MSLSTQQDDELYYLIQDIDNTLLDSIDVYRQAEVDGRKSGPYLYHATISGRLLGNSGPISPFTNTPVQSMDFGDNQPQLCIVDATTDVEMSDHLYVNSGITGAFTGVYDVQNTAQQTSYHESYALTVQLISTEDDR